MTVMNSEDVAESTDISEIGFSHSLADENSVLACASVNQEKAQGKLEFSSDISEDSSDNSPIDKLPLELLIKIFHLLPDADLLHRIPLVSKTWHRVSLTPVLRTRLVLRKNVPSDTLFQQFKTRPLMRVFHCPAMESAGSALVNAVLLTNSLRCLNIGFSHLTEECADCLSANLPPTLVHLNVEGLKTVGLKFITNLVDRCPNLQALNLSHCVAVCDNCVQLLSDKLPGLRRLNLDGVLWLTDVALQYLAGSSSLSTGSVSALWLDGFELTSSGISHFLQSVSDVQNKLRKDLYQLSSHPIDLLLKDADSLIGLHVLWISFCDHFTDGAIRPIRNLTGLTALTLRKAQQITTDGWQYIFRLDTGIPNTSLQWLEHLDLSECPSVNDSVVSSLCECCGPRLRSLILNWCWDLTDHGLDDIVFSCPALRHLSLVGNHSILGLALKNIPVKQPSMNVVNLAQCNLVFDSILNELAQEMPHLYVFDYFGEPVGGGPDDICHYDFLRSLEKVPICAD
ncbi:F-box/LRR-repeat protein 14 [Fasciola hepatica]|uniref:F-box/LRR-repeat protein 14 n=1 Tax=Fasciola hepatica TaxID=6192 RepID=A0A4E0RYC3_FASHE|nr:F-box/LRR-repeat protein 14 [Fasciola hepatica]